LLRGELRGVRRGDDLDAEKYICYRRGFLTQPEKRDKNVPPIVDLYKVVLYIVAATFRLRVLKRRLSPHAIRRGGKPVATMKFEAYKIFSYKEGLFLSLDGLRLIEEGINPPEADKGEGEIF
jgi:hypothetical protein